MSPLSVFSNGLIVRERHFNEERAILYLGTVLYAGDRLHQHARPQQRALPQPRRAEAPPGKFSVEIIIFCIFCPVVLPDGTDLNTCSCSA